MRLILGFVFLLITNNAFSATHAWKQIEMLHSGDTRGCYMFTLEDVSVADPEVASGGKWFAIMHTHEAAKEMFSLVLAAKTSRTSVQVKTNKDVTCDGHVAVKNLIIR